MDEIRNLTENRKDKIKVKIKKRITMQLLILVASILLVVVLIFAMTAAWFTNVAQTSDLVFKTESWGFDSEKITVAESSIAIAPGTSGIVPLTVDNSGGMESVKIGVTISKAAMDPELQKRIFFYADVAKTQETEVGAVEDAAAGTTTGDATTGTTVGTVAETTSRVYLGASSPENYVYTILAGQKLTMNDIYYNDVPIKWEWVYDMVGYYFRGTVNDSAETAVTVDEYVRPIAYDYEQAVFETGTEKSVHQLVKIGETAVSDFLTEISSEDGYKGNIDVAEAVTVGNQIYYPVEIDSNGYGVWAYLCTQEEVEAGISYDTGLANSTEAVTATATIILTAYNVSAETEPVNTEAQLKAALTNDKVDVVELSADVSLESSISFTEGTKVLNLNGYTLGYSGTETEYSMISVTDGATLTVTGGEVVGTSNATALSGKLNIKAFDTAGGNLVLSGVKVSGVDSAVYVQDMTSQTADSTIQIINCDLSSAQTTIVLQGNGSATVANTKMVIQDSKVYSEYYVAIIGQGNSSAEDARWGTELVLVNSEIYGYYGGLYQPQQRSVTTISKCKISGMTGIAVKGGTVNIYDSEIAGTGSAEEILAAAVLKSGYTDTGDGVYVEVGYDWTVSVTLKGENVITSNAAYAVEMVGTEGKGPGKVLIYDGTFTGAAGSANWNDYGTFEIYGGTYNGTVNGTITRYDANE
ncbi:MAG: hypothetical protein J6C37_00060 [Roseburia sp.]|nr:hypothetical protein [Roseburia sp.]